jgi:hypothetical protein
LIHLNFDQLTAALASLSRTMFSAATMTAGSKPVLQNGEFRACRDRYRPRPNDISLACSVIRQFVQAPIFVFYRGDTF